MCHCSLLRGGECAFILAPRDPWPGTPVVSDHGRKSEVMEIRWDANATVQDMTILVAWLPVPPETRGFSPESAGKPVLSGLPNSPGGSLLYGSGLQAQNPCCSQVPSSHSPPHCQLAPTSLELTAADPAFWQNVDVGFHSHINLGSHVNTHMCATHPNNWQQCNWSWESLCVGGMMEDQDGPRVSWGPSLSLSRPGSHRQKMLSKGKDQGRHLMRPPLARQVHRECSNHAEVSWAARDDKVSRVGQ